MPESIELIIPSNPKYMRLLRKLIEDSAELMGFNEIDSENISLAVDEACTNIIRHSYDNDFNQKIIINLYSDEKKMQVYLKDFGKRLNPSEIKIKNKRKLKPGGLGIGLIVKIMDIVEYNKTLEYNIVKLTKFLKSK